ncbi:MAG TPA: MerR family transcriptional regulator [Vicinamibacterales bacterium]|nr:MerR family transcriptional regulator [Vicinamibacterales bacterium]
MSSTTLGPRELARQSGVSTDTLRHYERKGLIARPQRTSAGYRRYPAEAVGRVRLIQRALVVGFSLNELARVLKERDRGGAPCRSVRALLDARLVDVIRQIGELKGLKRELVALAALWDQKLASVAPGQPARLLDELHQHPALDRLAGRRLPGRPRPNEGRRG